VTERTGRCLNTDYCALGDARSVVRLPADAPYICPECAHGLVPVPRWSSPREAASLALGVLLVAGSAGAGFVTANSINGDHIWQRVQGFAARAPRRVALAPHVAAPTAPVTRILSYATFTPTPPAVTVLASATFAAVPTVVSVVAIASFTPPPLPLPLRVILRLSGSDTVAAGPLSRLAATFLARRGDTDIDVETPGRDEMRVVGTQRDHRDAVVITSDGSAQGMAALAHGRADLAVLARPAAVEEVSAVVARDKSHDVILQYPVADDPVAIIVNPDSPLKEMTLAEAQAVFGGNGRLSGITRRYASDDMSGLDAGLKHPQVGKLDIGESVNRMRDGRAVADAVAADPGGIGLVPLSLAGDNHVVALRDRDPIKLTHPLFLVGQAHAANAEARDFVRFVLSSAGQDAVQAAGLIRLPPPAAAKTQPPPATAAVPDPKTQPAVADDPVAEKDPFAGMDVLSQSSHVFTMPAGGKLVNASLADVKFPSGPPVSAHATSDTGDAKLPPPSPANGVMKVDCVIELTGVPSDCKVVSAKGTKSGSKAVLEWLSSGGVRYSPSTKDGKPVATRRELTVSYRPPPGNGGS